VKNVDGYRRKVRRRFFPPTPPYLPGTPNFGGGYLTWGERTSSKNLAKIQFTIQTKLRSVWIPPLEFCDFEMHLQNKTGPPPHFLL